MISRFLFAASVLLAALAVFAPTAAGAESSLEVKDLRVEFLDGERVRVRGQLRCRHLKPAGASSASDVDVNIDFPHAKRGFSLLPEEWWGLPTDPKNRKDEVAQGVRTAYSYEGKSYSAGRHREIFYNSTYILRPAVMEKTLRKAVDEGRWVAFDKTLLFKYPADKVGLRYRVVVGWKIYYEEGGDFEHVYLWAVYGPFAWGKAPPCRGMLRATPRRPVSFTAKGVVTKKPVGKAIEKRPGRDNGAGKEGPTEDKRPKPTRTGKRPSQLDAANASEKLAAILMKFAEIENAGARANPFVGRIEVRHGAKASGEARTALAARVAVEGAHGFPWVKTLQVVLRVAKREVMATVSWEAAASYAAKESTLLEFYKTWKVTGGTLAAPKTK